MPKYTYICISSQKLKGSQDLAKDPNIIGKLMFAFFLKDGAYYKKQDISSIAWNRESLGKKNGIEKPEIYNVTWNVEGTFGQLIAVNGRLIW